MDILKLNYRICFYWAIFTHFLSKFFNGCKFNNVAQLSLVKAMKKVPSDRRGRACKMKLVPSSNSSVLGDRIDIMSNAVGANNQFKTNVATLNGNTEVSFLIEGAL